MTDRLRIGTRGSALAVAQARQMAAAIEASSAGVRVELVTIKTSGDRITDRPLAGVGGKGLFVKEIEEALLDGGVDLAVHSMKDLPAESPAGLVIAAVPERADARDVLISKTGGDLASLAPGARVGTSSLRRAALVLACRPDAEIVPLRGNVETRLRRLREGAVEAILLAAAGLARLGLDVAGARPLPPADFVPAIGQGALALQTREKGEARRIAGRLDHPPSSAAAAAERAFMQRTGGSCVTPLAAHATVDGARLALRAVILSPDGRTCVRGDTEGATVEAAALGTALAGDMLGRGGAEILEHLREELA